MLWRNREEICKGWSEDRKYRVTDEDGHTFLLRVSPDDHFDSKRKEFDLVQICCSLGVPAMKPISLSINEEGVCSVYEWINGQDAEIVIPTYTSEMAMSFGLDAGQALRFIHSIAAPENTEPWGTRYLQKLDRKIENYSTCGLRYDHDSAILSLLTEDRDLVKYRPQCFQHGDYHIGNMMIDNDGQLRIIDFNRWDIGDPWEEFNRIIWSAQASPAFASGIISGYFGGTDIPDDFWRLMRYYISANLLSSLPWAIPFGENEVRTMRKQAAEILSWYENMTRLIPSWYSAI